MQAQCSTEYVNNMMRRMTTTQHREVRMWMVLSLSMVQLTGADSTVQCWTQDQQSYVRQLIRGNTHLYDDALWKYITKNEILAMKTTRAKWNRADIQVSQNSSNRDAYFMTWIQMNSKDIFSRRTFIIE